MTFARRISSTVTRRVAVAETRAVAPRRMALAAGGGAQRGVLFDLQVHPVRWVQQRADESEEAGGALQSAEMTDAVRDRPGSQPTTIGSRATFRRRTVR